jgi:large conductance mechanosensitive channel
MPERQFHTPYGDPFDRDGSAPMIKGFKEFISQGNVVDLAVGVVVGAAFGAVVTSFTNDVLMGLIGAIVGEPNFDSLVLQIGNGEVAYGKFLTALVSFLLVVTAVYFAVVVPINAMRNRKDKPEDELSNEEKMLQLLERIAEK